MKKTMDENVIDVETEPVEEEDAQEVETEPKKKKFHLTKKGAIIGGACAAAGAAILVGAIKSIFGRSRHLEDLPDEDDQDEDEDSDDESDEDSSDE